MENYKRFQVNNENIIPNYNGVVYCWNDGRKPRNKKTLKLNDKKFWWIVGRYLGDGWIRQQGGIVICCAKTELNEITNVLDGYMNYCVCNEKTVYKIHIPSKELSIYLEQYGKGAENKHLTEDIINLPYELLNCFLEGYLSADGSKYKNVVQCNSVSRHLIYGLWQVMMKIYKKPVYIYKTKVKPKTVIQGRTVNQKPYYTLRVKFVKSKKGFYENGYMYYKSDTSFIKNNLIGELNSHEQIINNYVERLTEND